MKKRTITIGMLLLATNSFSQVDTLAESIYGKVKLEFNYYDATITKRTETDKYKDFTFKIRKNEYLYLDLFDFLNEDTLYLKQRKVTVYLRNNEVHQLLFDSNERTYAFNGILVRKVVVHKPELQ